MQSNRLSKVNKLLQKELNLIFQQTTREFFEGAMITVTEVRVAPDLSSARVYVSLFLTKDVYELIKVIQDNSKMIRGKLGNITRNQLRVVPELFFVLDDTLDKALRIEELLKKK